MARVLAKLRADEAPVADADDLEAESVAIALEGKPKKSKKRKSEVAAAEDVPVAGADAPVVKRKKSKSSKVADTPVSALSAIPPAAVDDSMDVDLSTVSAGDDKAARKAAKAAKKAAKAAAAQAAVSEEMGAGAASAPVMQLGEAVQEAGSTPAPKKKKRKSEAA